MSDDVSTVHQSAEYYYHPRDTEHVPVQDAISQRVPLYVGDVRPAFDVDGVHDYQCGDDVNQRDEYIAGVHVLAISWA